MKRTAIAVAACLTLAATVFAAAPTPAKRTPKVIDAELSDSIHELEGKHYPGDVVNPIYRKSMTGEAVPVLTHRLALDEEISAVSPAMKKTYRWALAKTQAKLAFYQNADAKAALDAQTSAADPLDATAAKLALQALAWWEATGKADGQATVLDAVVAIAKDQPKDDNVAYALKTLIDDNPANMELAARGWDAMATLKTPAAAELNATPNKVGKPLSIAGATLANKQFKSEQWKGKVVLVDFWATWCPPCREEIPHVAKLYADYHDKGLEIIGVSSDQDRHELADFLKQHTEMPWPQLFAGGPAWHPLTKKFGINGIPCMYLIDRNGVLVTVNARGLADELIPKLLDLPAATSEAPTSPAQAAALAELKKRYGMP